MIRLKDLLKEITIQGVRPNEFLKTFLDVVKEKYPNSVWRVSDDGRNLQSIESNNADEVSLIAWSIKVPSIKSINNKNFYVGIAIQDAFTKSYKNVLGNAIQIHIKNLLNKHRDAMPALFIVGDNWDPETWEHIANKYNITLINDDNYEDLVQMAEDEDDDEASDALIQELP